MIDAKPIPRRVLRAARARLCRRIAAAIISGMAETDSSVETIARRLGENPEAIKSRLDALIAGRSIKLGHVSDMCFAMGCELEMKIRPHQ